MSYKSTHNKNKYRNAPQVAQITTEVFPGDKKVTNLAGMGSLFNPFEVTEVLENGLN